MTIQIRTTQIPTIQVLIRIIKRIYHKKQYKFEKIKYTYVGLINIYYFLQNLKYFLNIFQNY